MTDDELADRIEALAAAATPAAEQSLRLDRWVEWRSPDGGEKYSIAEFEREPDQELYHALRQSVPAIVAALRLAARPAGGEVTWEVRSRPIPHDSKAFASAAEAAAWLRDVLDGDPRYEVVRVVRTPA